MMPPVDLIPVESLADLEPRYVYNLAITNQPLQRVNALRLQQASSLVKASRGAMYPTFFAQGGLSTSYVNIAETPVFQDLTNVTTPNFVTVGSTQYFVTIPQTRILTGTTKTPFGKQVNNNFGQSIGVGISFNIFNQHQARSQWNRSKIQVQQYRLQQEQDNATLQADIFNAYELAVSALEKFHASERQAAVSEQALELANKRYGLALMNVLDLIITQNNLQRARLEMVRNKYDYVFKMKVLEFYKGNGIRL
jgi:outer membrane protein